MPYGVIQQVTGSFEGASGSVTLAPTEAGSQILIFAGVVGTGVTLQDTSVALPTGFGALGIPGYGTRIDYARVQGFIKTSTTAGETSWTLSLTNSASRLVVWAAFEVYGLDSDWPDNAYRSATMTDSGTAATVTSTSQTATSISETYNGVSFMCAFAVNTGGTTPTLSGHTNGFWETASQSATDAASRAATLSVATKQELTVNTPACAVTVSPGSYVGNYLITLTTVDAHHAPAIMAMSGFEIGTATNIATTGLGSGDGTIAPFDGVVGSPAIVATTARSGAYCLELSSTAAAENLTWTTGASKNLSGSLIETWSERFHVRFPTALPSVNVELASVEIGSLANGLVIRYVTAFQQIGVRIGTGSEVLSDAAVVADQWIGIDFLYDPRATTHTCVWQVDYNAEVSDPTGPVAQAAASTTGMSAGTVTTVRHGWTTSITATVRYDDIAGSSRRKTYPIGDTRILPLKVDQAGTPTVFGSSANFRTFTANGTYAAWTAAGTIAALDDIPPVIGAGADGLAQITNATGDYVEVPMETYACATNNMIPMAGRWYWAGWAASGNPATLHTQVSDGTSAWGIFGDTVDAGFDNTTLVWMGQIHNKGNILTFYPLTQPLIDALAMRFGFSEDTNPDAGVHCVLFELAVQPATTIGILDAESGTFNVYARMNLNNGAVISLLATTPAGTRGATMTWTVDGVAYSQYVGPNTAWEVTVGAVDVSNVTQIGLLPDPTPP